MYKSEPDETLNNSIYCGGFPDNLWINQINTTFKNMTRL